jgi:hypothetical protein
MLVSRAFVEAFNLVHATFASPPADIEVAKALARVDMESAERAYFSTAAMIRAGWKPLEEQAAAFIARTDYREAA